MSAVLKVSRLKTHFFTRGGVVKAVDGVDFEVGRGEIMGLVGESGSGKSITGFSILGLIDPPGRIVEGSIKFNGDEIANAPQEQLAKLRGNRISMIFQDPQTSLNPLMTVEDQLIETIQTHSDVSYSDAHKRAVDLLEEIGIKNAQERIKAYPHQFFGGMRQRVVIALALCTDPELIVADEPTTALDVAVQHQLLDLIRDFADRRKIAFMLITHDIGVIAQIADRVTVMRHGKVMETGETRQVLGAPKHPYTVALMDAVPPLDRKIARFRLPAEAHEAEKLTAQGAKAKDWLLQGEQTPPMGLEVKNITMRFRGPRTSLWRKPESFTALSDVSFLMPPGTITGLVGESGSGKSTLAKMLTGLLTPQEGSLALGGATLPLGKARGRLHPSRRLMQMVFQDPYSSLNSRHKIGYILAEPLWLYGLVQDADKRRELSMAMLDLVGMPADVIDKYPHQFSGGQRQRITVARAILARPKFLICDEPTSALDVSIQAQVLNLLKDLQATFCLTILFITHNLSVTRQMSDNMIVLRNGRIEEQGTSEDVFSNPQAPYTKELLSLTPTMPDDWRAAG